MDAMGIGRSLQVLLGTRLPGARRPRDAVSDAYEFCVTLRILHSTSSLASLALCPSSAQHGYCNLNCCDT